MLSHVFHAPWHSYIKPLVLLACFKSDSLAGKISVNDSEARRQTTRKMPEERSIDRFETSHQQREGGGFLVRRPIGGRISECDPFLMLDHLGPVDYAPGEAVGAPDHPHRGFETVTYVIDGGEHCHRLVFFPWCRNHGTFSVTIFA